MLITCICAVSHLLPLNSRTQQATPESGKDPEPARLNRSTPEPGKQKSLSMCKDSCHVCTTARIGRKRIMQRWIDTSFDSIEAVKSGQLILAGRTKEPGDKTFGIAIFRASDEAAARAFVKADPLVSPD